MLNVGTRNRKALLGRVLCPNFGWSAFSCIEERGEITVQAQAELLS